MAPPRASTRKLTRKPALLEGNVPWVGLIIGVGYSGILQDGEYHCVSELLQIFLEWLKEWWVRKKRKKNKKKRKKEKDLTWMAGAIVGQKKKKRKRKKILLGWLEQ